jgi:predicted MFS family arabinose efflux permease
VGAPASYRSVLGVVEFRWLWCAQLLSVAGDQLARVALTVLVFDRTASAGLAALTYALTYLPDLVGGAVLSHVADRYSRRAVMVAADGARAVLVALMALPGIPLVVEGVLLVLVQLLAAPYQSARQAVLPTMLRGDRLTVGQGLLGLTYQAGLALGFGAGAGVVAAVGTSRALAVDAATFVVSGVLVAVGVAAHRPSRSAAEAGRVRRGAVMVAGWRLVTRDPRLRSLLIIACCCGFYVVPEGLAVPYAGQLHAGTGAVGWLLAANPVGTIIGITVLKRLPPVRRLRWLGPLVVATSLVLLPTGWAPGLVVTVVLWLVSGVCSAHDMITQAAYVAAVPDGQRGQAVGLAIAGLRASQGLGIVVAGAVAELVAPSLVIAVAAGLGVLVGGAAAWSWAASSRSAEGDETRNNHAG